MGIPFYFASLVKSHKRIVEPVKKNLPIEVDVLGVDFNCLIHRYLKDEDPVKSVVDAFEYILKYVCCAKHVIIALDGLVPYAKIVQQRYRRMRTKEEGSGPFDRNQISPDTPYMRELEQALAARFPYAHLSGTTVPGEGEHKLILEISKLPEDTRRSVCIYGLDADLILICLEHSTLSKNMYLLRESAEFNDPKLKEAEFATMNIQSLLAQLPLPINQYMALSILCFGNDFMPNLGIFSLREDGYQRALEFYELSGSPDLTTSSGRLQFLKYAGSKEMEVFKQRISIRKRPEERSILGKTPSLVSKKYGLHNLDGVTNMRPVVEAFWKTFQWTTYYFANSIPNNWGWVYPYADAPLISDILKFDDSISLENTTLNFSINNQLQFIMPESSLRKCKRRVLFADELHSETRNPWMKRHDWEMKPRISLPWNPIYAQTSVSLL